LDFRGASAFMFCYTNKDKRDTTLSYHLWTLQSCNFLCFMLLFISMSALFHSLLDYEVTLVAYFLLWIAWVLGHIVSIYTSMKQLRSWKFFYRSQLLTELLEDKQIAKLGGSWCVQNVSTSPNTFAIVSPLICVFWIQLTRTNAVFSRIALVSRFCAEIRLLGKILENIAKILFCQKTHGARRRYEGGQWPGLTTRGCSLALATPTCGEAASAVASTPPSAYIYPLTWKHRGFGVFPR
jgi:hypothetical protein